MQVNPCKHGRYCIGTLCLKLGVAGGYILPAFLQDAHDIKCGAASQPHQKHFHRARAEIFTPVVRRTIKLDAVAAAAGGFETGIAGPVYSCFHGMLLRCDCSGPTYVKAPTKMTCGRMLAQPASPGRPITDTCCILFPVARNRPSCYKLRSFARKKNEPARKAGCITNIGTRQYLRRHDSHYGHYRQAG